jgi:hypothetical protein
LEAALKRKSRSLSGIKIFSGLVHNRRRAQQILMEMAFSILLWVPAQMNIRRADKEFWRLMEKPATSSGSSKPPIRFTERRRFMMLMATVSRMFLSGAVLLTLKRWMEDRAGSFGNMHTMITKTIQF